MECYEAFVASHTSTVDNLLNNNGMCLGTPFKKTLFLSMDDRPGTKKWTIDHGLCTKNNNHPCLTTNKKAARVVTGHLNAR